MVSHYISIPLFPVFTVPLLYTVGGYDRTLHMDRASMECYDPVSEEWMFMSEMEKARSGLVLATIDQNIYAFGGRYRHTDQYYDLVER